MLRTSEEHVFALVERIRRRAARLLQGSRGAAATLPTDDGPLSSDALAPHLELRLPHLATTLQLPELAVDALVCLVASEYDPFLRLVARAIQSDGGRPWLELGTIAELLDLPPPAMPELGRLFAPSGVLRRWGLVLVDDIDSEVPLVAARAKVAARVAQFLVGDDALTEWLSRIEPADAPEVLVPRRTIEAVLARARRSLLRDERLAVEIHGPAGCGKRRVAALLAAELRRPLIIVDLERVPRRQFAEALRDGRREAMLAGALLCLARWDAHLAKPTDAEGAAAPPTRVLPDGLGRLLAEQGGVLLLTAAERDPLIEHAAQTVAHIEVPFPTPSERATLLRAALGQERASLGDDFDFSAIVRRFALDPERIRATARAAVALAAERDPMAVDAEVVAVAPTELIDACRRQVRHDLGGFAVRVTNSHRWEDLVVPVDVYDSLREMIAYVRHAGRVYDEWGFGVRHSLGEGLSALFSGPPGTGKTMCASVIARELDMELFRVDLSRVVSKWIGETEKNLSRVFDEAQRSNAIILFDEADSLFAKRTEVKSSVDRYANLEVNYLLQRMEAFGGITILTTNFEDTIDTAFKRRLTFRLRFERPDADARAALWEKVFPASCALAADVSTERLGELYDMSGGNIRNAAVRAAFLAASEDRAIDMATCMLAAERECREMGLLVRSALSAQRLSREVRDTPAPAASGESTAADAHGERSSTPAMPRPAARLVPITHPRG